MLNCEFFDYVFSFEFLKGQNKPLYHKKNKQTNKMRKTKQY